MKSGEHIEVSWVKLGIKEFDKTRLGRFKRRSENAWWVSLAEDQEKDNGTSR